MYKMFSEQGFNRLCFISTCICRKTEFVSKAVETIVLLYCKTLYTLCVR